ncbi:MAG: hypothetical protein KVP17_001144 [Porospora cf. gigantea B]|uniref:uncharacterized protein n=1 Tax=Porospora cf. gigantea B TaxID=2853592 RepID=UPI003571A0D6|nr:MAG: hypothetical protein KVP17_001144 [Porospora cf. gigantea B]
MLETQLTKEAAWFRWLEDQDEEDVMFMLENDPSLVSLRDDDGRTGLHWSCSLNHKSIIKKLLSYPDTERNARDLSGWTALHCASAAGSDEAVRLLLEDGDVDANACSDAGTTPLHHACSRNRDGIVQRLLAAGANVNAIDNYGRTPLLLCAGGHCAEVMRLLVDRDDLNFKEQQKGSQYSALHAAAEAQQEANIVLLASACPDLLFMKNSEGKTPLDLMTEKHFYLIKSKVKAGTIPKPAEGSNDFDGRNVDT